MSVALPSWAWARRLHLAHAVEGDRLWTNPQLPSPDLRPIHPVRVEVSVFEDFPQALRYLKHFFARTSVLVAIGRVDNVCRFLIYTSLSAALACERCRQLRETLRPTSIGWSFGIEPGWGALHALLEHEATSGGWLTRPCGGTGGTQR